MSDSLNPFWEDQKGPKEAERRTAARFHWSLVNFCPLFANIEGDSWLAKVQNISGEGISLIVRNWVKPGTELSIELVNTTQLFLCKLQLRVTYVQEYPNGYWILGGSFTEKLSDDQIRALLA